MKKLFLSLLLAACASNALAAPATNTGRPLDYYGRPVDPTYTIAVNPDGTAAGGATLAPAALTTALTTEAAMFAAPGAGLRTYVTGFTLCNSNAAGNVATLRSSLAGTVVWTGYVAPGQCVSPAPNTPLQSTVNGAFTYQFGSALATQYISAQGYVAP